MACSMCGLLGALQNPGPLVYSNANGLLKMWHVVRILLSQSSNFGDIDPFAHRRNA